MLDIAEATGRIESDSELIKSVGGRCLEFLHGGGVRGNPNSGVRMRKSYESVYADPWNNGYYDVEQSARDGHFWYRMAQHFENREFPWAAEQVTLGGRTARGNALDEYWSAYKKRFGWFSERDILPEIPKGTASIGLLSPKKQKIHERIFLRPGRLPGDPTVAFFLYD